jgi:hypothetical protein
MTFPDGTVKEGKFENNVFVDPNAEKPAVQKSEPRAGSPDSAIAQSEYVHPIRSISRGRTNSVIRQ